MCIVDLGTFKIQKYISLVPVPSSLTLNSDSTYTNAARTYSTGVAAIMSSASVPIIEKKLEIKNNLTSTYNVSTTKNSTLRSTQEHSSRKNITYSKTSTPKESSFLYANKIDPTEHYSTTSSRMTPKTLGVNGDVSTPFAGSKSVRSELENPQRVCVKGGVKGQKSVLKIVGGKSPSTGANNGGSNSENGSGTGTGMARNDVVALIGVYEKIQKNQKNSRLGPESAFSELSSVIVLTNSGRACRIEMNNQSEINRGESTDNNVRTLFYYHTDSLYGLAVEKNIPKYSQNFENRDLSFFVTGGDDKLLCVWCSKNRKLVVRARTDRPIRCVDFDSNNNFIAVGFNNGSFGIFGLITQKDEKSKRTNNSLNNFNNKKKNECENDMENEENIYFLFSLCQTKKMEEEISDIKFSPNSKMLAVGSHDDFIDM